MKPFFYLMGLALLLPGAALAQVLFGSPATYPSGGTSPSGVAVGDLNGDGRPDLVVTNNQSNTVNVLLNQAAAPGTFAAASSYAVATPYGVALGDVDGDGRLDAVVCSTSTSSVAVLLSSGAPVGSFRNATTYSCGGIASIQVALYDFNNDSRLDIAVTSAGSSSVGILPGLAGGTFGTAVSYASGGDNTLGLAVGEVNGDNRPDLVTANSGGAGSGGTVNVLLASATTPGAFVAGPGYPTGGSSPVGVALADLNRDGRLDILVGNPGTDNLGVLLANAAVPGTFAPAVAYPSGGSGPTFILATDINRDGWPDVVTGNQSDTKLSVLLGQPTAPGTLSAATTYATGGNGPFALALADVNGDGRSDIIATNYLSNTVAVLLNTAPLAAAAAAAAPTLAVYPNPTGGDFTVVVPSLPGTVPASLEVLDALGRVVRRQAAVVPGTTVPVAAAGLAAGFYVLRVQAGSTVLTQRMVVR